MTNDERLEIAKDAARIKLIRVYEERGLQASLDMSDSFLKDAGKTGKEFNIDDFGRILRGELSEIYAELCLREYVKTHRNSFYVKSLCFPKSDGSEGFTEVDLTLFTEKFVMLLECKSYTGEKTLTNEGCMNVKGRTSYNVWSQNRMHLKNLDPYINRCRLESFESGGAPYLLAMFSYSKDPIVDLRDDAWKKKFQLFTEKSMLDYLDKVHREKKLWDIPKLHKVITRLNVNSAQNKEKHIKILQERQAKGEIPNK